MGAVKVSSTLTRRRVLTLPAPELAMLMRFALVDELYGQEKEVMTMALAAYVGGKRIEALDCWWPLLRRFAAEWIACS